ncbi:MAG: 50S ribosome-binding GTPase [Nanoarchaeota archaeon]|nr:50S ribosome-binding GTPase [Nanoarchaeota archaeon]
MAVFWKLVNNVIRDADILLEVLDSRLVDESRNLEIEEKVRRLEKTLIFVINKCDLVDKAELEKYKRILRPCIFMSAKEHLGTSFLRKEIMKNAPKGKDKFTVGVLGYPNTGKSSVINALKGRTSAPIAPISGYTKGLQRVKISARMYLIDTPGVLPCTEKGGMNETKHAMIAAKTFGNLKDPEGAAIGIIREYAELIGRHYGVGVHEDALDTLEAIALKKKKLAKGGIPDTYAAARVVLQDWQKGKIGK